MSSIPNSAMPHAKARDDQDQPRTDRLAKTRSSAKATLTGVLGLPITLGVVGAAMVVRLFGKTPASGAPAQGEPEQLRTAG